MARKKKDAPDESKGDGKENNAAAGSTDAAGSGAKAESGSSEGSSQASDEKAKANKTRVDLDSIKNLQPSKYLEKRIGLSVRVTKPGVSFSMQTPAGVVNGEADQFVIQRQDGTRMVVGADDLADGFQFIR